MKQKAVLNQQAVLDIGKGHIASYIHTTSIEIPEAVRKSLGLPEGSQIFVVDNRAVIRLR